MTGVEDWMVRGFLLWGVFLFALVAVRPDWAVKLFSYGRYSLSDVNGSLLRTTRVLSAGCAIWCAAYVVWGFFRRGAG